MTLSPVQRHWRHVEELRQLYEAMAPGVGRERVKARWQAALEDHQQFVNQRNER